MAHPARTDDLFRDGSSLRSGHMRRFLAGAALFTALTTAACGNDKPAAAPSEPAPSVVPSTVPADPDTKGALACKLIAQAAAGDSATAMTDKDTVLPITQAAAQSDDPDIQAAGQELYSKYADAVLAAGTDDETSSKVNAFTAGVKLRTVCIKAGLDS